MERFSNQGSAELSGDIDAFATGINVRNPIRIPSDGGVFRVRCDDELMTVVSASGLTWAVQRGTDDSTPAPHSDGKQLVAVVTRSAMDSILSLQNASGAEISNRRVLRFTGATVEDDPTNQLASITVPSSEAPLTIPVLSDWSWVNQGVASVTPNPNGLYLRSLTSGAGEQLRILARSVPATPWAATFRTATFIGGSGNNISVGVAFLNSAGNISTLCLNSTATGAWQGYVWTSPTLYSGTNRFSASFPPGAFANWLKLRDDGSNIYFAVSVDGYAFHDLASVSRATFTPDRVGFFVNPYQSSGDAGIRLSSFAFS